jgi:hypothetical protein
MSYDIAVFEPEAFLRDREAFLDWFEARSQWGERANDPTHATPQLQAWFEEIAKIFPPMNGPNRPAFEDEEAWDRAVDYVFAGDMIYAAISGMRGAQAYGVVSRLAGQFGIGVYTVSDAGEVWFPAANGQLEVVFQTSE